MSRIRKTPELLVKSPEGNVDLAASVRKLIEKILMATQNLSPDAVYQVRTSFYSGILNIAGTETRPDGDQGAVFRQLSPLVGHLAQELRCHFPTEEYISNPLDMPFMGMINDSTSWTFSCEADTRGAEFVTGSMFQSVPPNLVNGSVNADLWSEIEGRRVEKTTVCNSLNDCRGTRESVVSVTLHFVPESEQK
ncbi:MAG: hypothetical protein HY817_04040 [Candidatus Abawacabacteria bacterium]|nr:hypothetical protein [Candidatus Abawacabacteria bacterium]